MFCQLGNTHVVPLPLPLLVMPRLARGVAGDLHFRYFYQLLTSQAGYAGERAGWGPQSGLVEAWADQIFLNTKVVFACQLPAVQ